MKRSRQVLAPLLFAAAAAVLYARQLDVSPSAMHAHEIAIGRQASSLAQTGRDLDGRRLPLYFHVRGNVWTPPLPVYFTLLVMTMIGMPEWGARLPSVVVAAIDVALIYLIAARLFKRESLALLAAALLALTPSHFIHGRLALASVYPVPFILVWLYCLMLFVERRQLSLLVASTVSLGVGFYSHPTAVLTMPVYFGLTVIVVLAVRGSVPMHAAALAGFIAPLLLVIPWFYVHREIFPFTLGDWGLQTLANPSVGLRYSLLSWPALTTRSTVYWGFFSPSYLFFTGGADLVSSTRQAGVFLGVMAIPLVYGIVEIIKSRWPDPLWRVILLAFALSPFAAATFTDAKAASRAVGMLPLGVLVAVAGLESLIGHRQRALRVAGFAVLLLLPIQFYRFYDDYLTDYPERSYAVFAESLARE